MAIKTGQTNSFSPNTQAKSGEVNTNFTEIWSEVQFIGFRVRQSANQEDLADGATEVQFDTEDFDVGSNFDTGTYKFTAPYDGYYWFHAQVIWVSAEGDNFRYDVRLYHNDAFTSVGRIAGGLVTSGNDADNRYPVPQTTQICALSAGDTMGVYGFKDTEGGNTGDIYKSSYGEFGHFMGYILARNDY